MNKENLSELQSISVLMQFFDGLNEPWGIKDRQSRHVYMNHSARLYTNTPATFTVEGRLDAEFPAQWSELAEELIEHDRLTEASGHRVAVIETHYWNGSEFVAPYISEKMPIYDNQKRCVGTVWNAKKLDNLTPLKYIKKQKPAVLKTQPLTDCFTRAEWLIIFFALQRYSSKEIARQLNISPKTVENRLHQMYQKTATHPLTQFIEYCKVKGWDDYIPYDFLVKGVQFI